MVECSGTGLDAGRVRQSKTKILKGTNDGLGLGHVEPAKRGSVPRVYSQNLNLRIGHCRGASFRKSMSDECKTFASNPHHRLYVALYVGRRL